MSADLIGFAASGWAFREAVRVPGRALVLSVVARAVADAHAERVEIAATDVPQGKRLAARALGRAVLTTPLHAAFLSALAAGEDAGIGAPIVCAAFAAGESIDAAGALVLDAIIAGTEVAVRVERALGPSHARRGWDSRGTSGRLGAALAVARILGLQREPTRNAFGIAATAAGGLLSARGTMTAAFVGAAAAADGVEAALLARADFTGAPLALDGRRGIAALMADSFAAPALTDGLGERFVFETATQAPVAVPDGIANAVARMERLRSIRELIDATVGVRAT